MADEPAPDAPTAALAEQTRKAWLQFRQELHGLRPQLFRFCRHLTRTPWDAEDLVQDTLLRAYVSLGSQYGQEIKNARAWLFRIATHSFIDGQRVRKEALVADPSLEPSAPPGPELQAQREAAGSLLAQLSPQERVAVVMKDVFEFTLEEIADVLVTTPGAIKAALHRGRERLAEMSPARARPATPAALREFRDAFNARDLPRLTAVLLSSAKIELPGVATDWGVAASSDTESGLLYHALLTPLSSGVPGEYLTDYLPQPARAELQHVNGEPLLLVWYAHRGGEALRSFWRFQVDEPSERVSGVTMYYYSPEALEELAAELGVPFRSNGYGF